MTALECYIADSMEETMRSFTESEEYMAPRAAINKMIAEVRAELNPEMQKSFNTLMDMMNNAHADFAAKAYTYGVVNGIALREQVMTP